MSATLRTVAALLLTTWLAACESKRQATEVVVVLDSDLHIGTELSAITVAVRSRNDLSRDPLRSKVLTLTDAQADDDPARHQLPLSFVLAPDQQQSAQDFRLVVTGLDASGDEVVEQQAIASFRPDFSLRLDIFLGKRCVKQLCRGPAGELVSETCNIETGMCEEVEESVLRPTTPGALGGYSRPDATSVDPLADAGDTMDGASAGDAAEGADADLLSAADGGQEAGPVDAAQPDAALPDLGVRELSAAGVHPVVAASASGRGVVVWQEQNAASRRELRAALYLPAGGWQPTMNLSAAKGPDYDDQLASVVMDGAGNVTVAWTRFFDVQTRRYVAQREAWDEELQVRRSDVAGPAQLVVDGSGNVTVAWYTYSQDLNSARFDAASGTWDALVGFVNTAGNRGNGPFALSPDGLGNVFAAWTTDGSVWANRLSSSSGRWQTPTQVLRTNQPAIQGTDPVVAGGSDGSALVLWRHTSAEDFWVRTGANRYVYGTSTWAITSPDDPAMVQGDSEYPKVASDPRGGFVVYALGQARSVDAAGQWGPYQHVGRPGTLSLTTPYQLDLRVDAHGTRIAAWAQDVPGGPDAVYSYVARGSQSDAWSDITRLDVKLPQAEDLKAAGHPHLAVAAPGLALMTWAESTATGTAVRARWISYPSPAP